MMNKEQKKNYISEMTSQFENSKAVMITHYQGLTMPQLDELRSKMRVIYLNFKLKIVKSNSIMLTLNISLQTKKQLII